MSIPGINGEELICYGFYVPAIFVDGSIVGIDTGLRNWHARRSGALTNVYPEFDLLLLSRLLYSGASAVVSENTASKTVTNAGEMLGDFGIPKLYTYTSSGKSVFVSPHAMKHLEELAANGAKLGPDYMKLLGQTHRKALHPAIDDVLSRGTIQYRKMYYSSGNEIMFGAPRSAGELPAVIHFK